MDRKEVIKQLKQYFKIEELVCKHCYKTFGENSWRFLDKNLMIFLLWLRKNIDKPITINNWNIGGQFSQRGIRCNLCDLVKSKTIRNKIYLSAHIFGCAIDFNVKGMTSGEVNKWLDDHKTELPVSIRLERNTNGWTHVDTLVTDDTKLIEYFNG